MGKKKEGSAAETADKQDPAEQSEQSEQQHQPEQADQPEQVTEQEEPEQPAANEQASDTVADEQQDEVSDTSSASPPDETLKVRVLVDCFAGKCNTIATVKRSDLPSLEGKVDPSPEAIAYVESQA